MSPGRTIPAARFAGDEFVILCDDVRRVADAEMLANRIHEALTEPFQLADAAVTITASVGLAFAGRAEQASHQLLVNADVAMYQVKHRGGASHQVMDRREPPDPGDQSSQEVDRRSRLDSPAGPT